MRSLGYLLRPLAEFSIAFYSFYMIYAILGIRFFGGEVNREAVNLIVDSNPDSSIEKEWVLYNFNDYLMALNTLFGFMWQNNWQDTVYMYQLLFEHNCDRRIILYFVSFT